MHKEDNLADKIVATIAWFGVVVLIGIAFLI